MWYQLSNSFSVSIFRGSALLANSRSSIHTHTVPLLLANIHFTLEHFFNNYVVTSFNTVAVISITISKPPSNQELLLHHHGTSDRLDKWDKGLSFRVSTCFTSGVHPYGRDEEETCQRTENLRCQGRQKARHLQHMGGMFKSGYGS
jgi:hypothetical protein